MNDLEFLGVDLTHLIKPVMRQADDDILKKYYTQSNVYEYGDNAKKKKDKKRVDKSFEDVLYSSYEPQTDTMVCKDGSKMRFDAYTAYLKENHLDGLDNV